MMSERIDVTVVGAGMVGAAAACLLARCGFSVAVLEASPPPPWSAAEDYGLRVSALSPGSQAILEQAGAWQGIAAARHCAYRRMRIEDRVAEASLEFAAPDYGLERLGTIVENDLVQQSLWTALGANPLVQMHCPARLASIRRHRDGIEALLEDGRVIRSSLLLATDGPESRLRRLAGARQDLWEYNQQGLVCVVRKQQANPGIAWQRFLHTGPLAFLPLADGRSSIVWTLPAQRATELLAASGEEFRAALDEASAGWLGSVASTGPRAAFPLSMRLSDRHVSDRVVLLGDAAQVVHPLAGQGVNMGFADVAALLETLVDGRLAGADPADPVRLEAFQRWRRSEGRLMAGGIHGLGALFAGEALAPLRRLGLALVGRSWLAGEAFVRRAAGLNRQAPRLSRGATLAQLLRPGAGNRAAESA